MLVLTSMFGSFRLNKSLTTKEALGFFVGVISTAVLINSVISILQKTKIKQSK